jgi:hypothetical protein
MCSIAAVKPSEHSLEMMMMFTLKKGYNEGVKKSNPTPKRRPAKGISKRVNIQIITNTYYSDSKKFRLDRAPPLSLEQLLIITTYILEGKG